MNSFNETSDKLKKAITKEKQFVEALDLIQRIIEAKIGDPNRLAHIKVTLENGSTLYESDKQYFEEKSKQLQQLVANQRKAELALQALNKLRESELRDSQRLDAIKKALQEGRKVAESEINFLNTKYEELQQEMDYQNRLQWTIDLIVRLHNAEIGDYRRLDTIKSALEGGRSVDQSEISYLKEKYKMLRKIDDSKKVQWAIDTIKKLQQAEIGNYERLEAIKTELEEKGNVAESEISYIKEKYEQLHIIKKSKQESDENNTENMEQANIDTILDIKKISELGKNKN